MFGRKKKSDDETAITVINKEEVVDHEADGDADIKKSAAEESKTKKVNPIVRKVVGGELYDKTSTAIDKVSSIIDVAGPIITDLINNRSLIKRRLHSIVTVISVLFFIIYVPILLFNKLATGLSLGWELALYICIGVYGAALIVFIVVWVQSARCSSTAAGKHIHFAFGIITYILRLASLALAITAICISGSGESSALDVITLVLAIVSLVFTSLSLMFNGTAGFIKWLISPAKTRMHFTAVALEWKQNLDGVNKSKPKSFIKLLKANRDRVDMCLDAYLLNTFSKVYIDKIDDEDIAELLSSVPAENKNLTEWIIKDVFAYASGCGYVKVNPCEKLDLQGDITAEGTILQKVEEKKNKVFGRFGLRRKMAEAAVGDASVSDEPQENTKRSNSKKKKKLSKSSAVKQTDEASAETVLPAVTDGELQTNEENTQKKGKFRRLFFRNKK